MSDDPELDRMIAASRADLAWRVREAASDQRRKEMLDALR